MNRVIHHLFVVVVCLGLVRPVRPFSGTSGPFVFNTRSSTAVVGSETRCLPEHCRQRKASFPAVVYLSRQDDIFDDDDDDEYEYARVGRRRGRGTDRYDDDEYERDETDRRRDAYYDDEDEEDYDDEYDDDDDFDLDDIVENMDFDVTIPNPILDSVDPERSLDRFDELLRDKTFLRDAAIMGVVLYFYVTIPNDMSDLAGDFWPVN